MESRKGTTVDAMTLDGPVPGTATLAQFGDAQGLPAGYTEEEWFLEGTATAYGLEGLPSEDGRWSAVPGDRAAFKTRLVVRRPADAARCNGAVLVEWLNVSSGADLAPEWMSTHRHLQRAGFTWVGVSAQHVGIEGGGFVAGQHLKAADPDRYESLVHPGDRYAFDIFTQAARAVCDNLAGVLGPWPAQRLLAAGASQSAMCLTTYANAIAPLAHVFDGYLVHSRPGATGGLEGPFPHDADVDTAVRVFDGPPVRIRDDLDVPVLMLQTETDVVAMGASGARRPDSDRFRLWEIAGAAHADTYMLVAASAHADATSIDTLAQLCAPTTTPFGPELPLPTPINSGPQHHYVAQAALAHLDRWVRTGEGPPAAPRLETAGTPATLVLDEQGIASGGIRTGFVDVPAAVLSGLGQDRQSLMFLFGSTRPFGVETLEALYPGGRTEYAKRFADATDEAVRQGFVLADDAEEMNALADAMYPVE
jgi:hypothetical protein